MAVEVVMPKFGLTMQEGTIQRFFKAPGEPVRIGDALFEIETEKILFEVESPASGMLAVVLAEEGATLACGAPVAVIAEPNEDPAAIRERYRDEMERAAASSSAPASFRAAAAASVPIEARPPSDTSRRRPASPVARKLAAELGVDLERITATGPGGRITREDVERAAASAPSRASAQSLRSGQASWPARTIPFRAMRRTIAARMHQSLRDTAQITITTEADVTEATDLRTRLAREFDFTYTDLMIYAVARALVKHPRMNGRLEGDEIVLPAQVNVGLAVALEEGLIVPVIHDAANQSLRQIAAQSRGLCERARAGKLALEEVSGGTFTISNLGTYGVDAFTPILNPGETGVLGVGRIVEKPAVYRGEIVPRSMMTLSLTFDHRLIDGAPAAAFLGAVVEGFNRGE